MRCKRKWRGRRGGLCAFCIQCGERARDTRFHCGCVGVALARRKMRVKQRIDKRIIRACLCFSLGHARTIEGVVVLLVALFVVLFAHAHASVPSPHSLANTLFPRKHSASIARARCKRFFTNSSFPPIACATSANCFVSR